MAVTLINMPVVVDGLTTYNYTIPSDGVYSIDVNITEVPPSSLALLIKKNGSTIASFSSPAAAQQVINLGVKSNCSANDVISIVPSSTAAIDQQLNTVKIQINIRQGLV